MVSTPEWKSGFSRRTDIITVAFHSRFHLQPRPWAPVAGHRGRTQPLALGAQGVAEAPFANAKRLRPQLPETATPAHPQEECGGFTLTTHPESKCTFSFCTVLFLYLDDECFIFILIAEAQSQFWLCPCCSSHPCSCFTSGASWLERKREDTADLSVFVVRERIETACVIYGRDNYAIMNCKVVIEPAFPAFKCYDLIIPHNIIFHVEYFYSIF